MEKEEKKFFEKWWFLVIIAVAIITIVAILGAENTYTDSVETASINNTEQTLIERKTYEKTQDYNGTYSFSLSDDNGSGYTFYAIGAISFDGDACKIKYTTSKTSSTTEDIELEGICGLNKEDMSTFYFTIYTSKNKEVCTYKCSKSENNIIGELKSEYNLAGCNINKKIDLMYVNDTQDINTAFYEINKQEKERKEAEEKAKKEQEENSFKASCKTYTFEQMARNPNKFKGNNVKVTGEVVQTLYNTNTVDLRVNITKNGSYSTYYLDTIYVTYTPQVGEDKILKDDIITIYGTAQGDYSYTSTMGSTVTLPLIYAKYITIEK